ncbi:MAG: signal peptidase I [Candidatus Uhrbacteria bacterium]
MFDNKRELDTFWHRKLGPTLGAVALFILEVVQIVIISAAIIIPIRYFLIQPFYVKGASMEPSYYDHEYLIIDEITYRFNQPERGQVVVFRYPLDQSQFFIKRVIGLPGETVEVSDGAVTIFNIDNPGGVVLDEEYLNNTQTFGKKRVALNADEYFVLGDNRDESLDSRRFGPIRESDIVGRVWIRGLPLSRLGMFEPPEYNF